MQGNHYSTIRTAEVTRDFLGTDAVSNCIGSHSRLRLCRPVRGKSLTCRRSTNHSRSLTVERRSETRERGRAWSASQRLAAHRNGRAVGNNIETASVPFSPMGGSFLIDNSDRTLTIAPWERPQLQTWITCDARQIFAGMEPSGAVVSTIA